MVKQLKLNFIRSPNNNRQLKILGPAHSKLLKQTIPDNAELKKTRNAFKQILKLNKGDLNMVEELSRSKVGLNSITIDNLLNKALQKQYLIEIKLTNHEFSKFVTLNNNSRNSIKKFLKTFFITGVQTEVIFSDALIGFEIQEIEFLRFIEKGLGGFIDQDGAYFAYFNKTPLNLKNYQILTEDEYEKEKNILDESCIIYALKLLKKPEDKINNFKLAMNNGTHFAKKNFNILCSIIETSIKLYSYDKDNRIVCQKYGTYENFIELAIFKNHYFIYDSTPYSAFCIKNYEKCIEYNNFENITRFKHNKPAFKKSKKISSLQLIKSMFDQGLFSDASYKLINNVEHHKIKNIYIPLTNIENEQEEFIYKESKEKQYCNYYADTETITNNQTLLNHQILALGIVGEHSDNVKIWTIRETTPDKITLNFLDYMCKYYKGDEKLNIKCYFHNLKYDYSILLKHLNISSNCKKDGMLYFSIIHHKYKGKIYNIFLADSYKLINIKLADFNKTFNLDENLNKKEAIAYNYYNIINTHTDNKYDHIKDYIEHIKEDEHKIFYKALNDNKKLFEYDEEKQTFNAMNYYKYYLHFDCLILKKGLKVLELKLKEFTGLNILSSFTISSFSNKYFSMKGAFDNVFKCNGNYRDYLANAVIGGRVNVLESIKKKIIEVPLVDYDARSLYPSAIYRICEEDGIPTGPAKRLSKEQLNIESLNKFNYYVCTVKIIKINKKQQMPFISTKIKGILKYINEVPEEGLFCIIDKLTLEDYIKFHQIDFEIIDGVYYNEGFNKKFGKSIEYLYNKRIEYQKLEKEGNEQEQAEGGIMQNLIKLILNSAYGKTITRKSDTEKILKTKGDETNKYILSNFNRIIDYTQINDRQIEININKVDNDYNLSIIGIQILSMSKRIMNEVMGIANDNKIKVYYQDTDSMHIEKAQIKELEDKYEQQYNKILKGKQMGQFHSDFSLKGSIKEFEVYASKSIFLGKKCYIDLLNGLNKNNEKITGHHVRLKGVTQAGIDHATEKEEGGIFKIFERLSNGEAIEFIMNPLNSVSFEYTKTGIFTRKQESFKRVIKF